MRVEESRKNRFIASKAVCCALLLLAGVTILVVPTVSAYEEINRGCWYHFTTADGGADSEGTWFSDGRHTESTKRVEAYSTCILTGLGATGWAEVWKTVQCTASGDYFTNMDGNYWVVMSVSGLAAAYIEFKLRIKDLSTGDVIASTVIYQKSIGGLMALNVQSNFYSTLIWYGQAGHQYGLELYAKAFTGGVLGGAIVDAAGDGSYFGGLQGAYYRYVEVGTYTQGGGGCVWENSLVTMGNWGFEPARNVMPNEKVRSYNLETGSIVKETVIANNRTNVEVVEVINDGLLVVTPWDQPIYARNETFVGWVKDPLNLTIGWEMFSPLIHSWIPVTNIEYEFGSFWVQDISVTGPNNFIVNGILVDAKIP